MSNSWPKASLARWCGRPRFYCLKEIGRTKFLSNLLTHPQPYAEKNIIDAALAGRHDGHAGRGKEREQVFLCANGSNLQLGLVSR